MPILNLRIDQGTTFSTDLTIEQSAGVPLDLTGYFLRSQIRKHYRSLVITETFSAAVRTGVSRITLDDAGPNYISTPSVFIHPMNGDVPLILATATATVVSNVITAITVDEPGSGYISVPTITFSRSLTEFVTNGTFDADISGWIDSSSGTGSISWNASGYIDINDAVGGDGVATQQLTGLTIDTSYNIIFDIIDRGNLGVSIWIGTSPIGNQIFSVGGLNLGKHSLTFIPTVTDPYISIIADGFGFATTITLDNISIQESALATAIPDKIDGKINIALADTQTGAIKSGRYVYDLESILSIKIAGGGNVVPGNVSISFIPDADGDLLVTSGGVFDPAITFGTLLTIKNAEDAGNNQSFTVKERRDDAILVLISSNVIIENPNDQTVSFTAVNNTIDRVIEGIITVTPEVTK